MILGAAALWLASCGSGPSTPSSTSQPASSGGSSSQSGSPDACSLYTLADAQRILGSNAKKGTLGDLGSSSPQFSVSTCSYTADSGSGIGDFVSTTVLVRRAQDAGEGKKDFLSVKGQTQGTQDVAGVGEMAYWNPAAGQLNVWKGKDWVIISAGRTAPKNMDVAKQVAAAILARE